jgi:hypothetical protein
MCKASRAGSSHYKIAHPKMPKKLTIPFKRPIRPVYIRQLVAFVEELRKLDAQP